MSDNWKSPPAILLAVQRVLGDYHDPCPIDGKGGLTTWWPKDIPVYVNPPYSKPNLIRWTQKFLDEMVRRDSGIFLGPDLTSSEWWQTHQREARAACFCSPRLAFAELDDDLLEGLTVKASNNRGTTIFYYGESPSLFGDEFSRFGVVR